MMKNLLKSVMLLGLLSVGMQACKKDDPDPMPESQTATVNMHLKDAPGDYDAVWLNVQSVEVTMEGKAAVQLIPFRPGMYDIMKFRNGLDTLLLRGTVPVGKVGQIRLILGDGNTVVVDGVPQPLTTPSAQESGLKLNVNETFVAGGAYDIWLDFDAGKSIHETGNGKYMLKPVIRAYTAATDGRIKGYVLPEIALTTVYVSNGVDTYSAITGPGGYFMFTGLPSGTYSVTYDAAITSYIDVTVPGVAVTYGNTTDLGTTILIQ
jgi:hypothetical protein